MNQSSPLHDSSATMTSIMIGGSPLRDPSPNLVSKFVQERYPLHSSCNLEVGVNGKEVFRLHKKPLLARCGLLVKLVREANSIRPREADSLKTVLTVELENFPGGPDGFELAAKFCYRETDIAVTLSNVAILRSVAEFLEMTEEYGKANLCRRTEYFLKHEVLWNWSDTLCVLKCCEPFIVVAEKANIIQRCVKALAFRASSSPESVSDPPSLSSFSSDSHDHVLNCSSASNSSRSSGKSPISGTWWFKDVSSLSVYLMERLVRALIKNGIDHKNLAKFLFHYLQSSLPTLKFGSYGVFGSSHLSPGNSSRRSEEDTSQKDSLKLQIEVLETVVELLTNLQPRSASSRSLFCVLRTAVVINASKTCRRELERMIGLQLDEATLDNILVPALPRRSSSFYNVDLIVRLSEHFLRDQAEALSSLAATPDYVYKKYDNEQTSSHDPNAPVRTALIRVGELIDKYLAEVAADSQLKPAKFRALAEVLPDTARNSSDGLYRAIEIFLEAHPSLTVAEATGLCKVINLDKLGLDACKCVAQNPKFPASFILQVVLVHQRQFRYAMDSCVPKEFQDMKCKPWKDVYTYNKEGRLNRQAMVVHLECSNFEFMVRQNQDLKRNLKTMQTRVSELESTYKRLRMEMGRLFRTKRRWKSGPQAKATASKLRNVDVYPQPDQPLWNPI